MHVAGRKPVSLQIPVALSYSPRPFAPNSRPSKTKPHPPQLWALRTRLLQEAFPDLSRRVWGLCSGAARVPENTSGS